MKTCIASAPLITCFFVLFCLAADPEPSEPEGGRPVLLMVLFAWAAEPPPELMLALQRREELVGTFQCVTFGLGKEGMRSRGIARGAELVWIRDGTRSGVTSQTEDGRPVYGRESGVLVRPEGTYTKSMNISGLHLHSHYALLRDLRFVGALQGLPPAAGARANLEQIVTSRLGGDVSSQDLLWSLTVEDSGLRRVTVRKPPDDSGQDRAPSMHLFWLIDPEIDWNIVSCGEMLDETVLMDVSTEYEHQADTWSPRKVTVRSDGRTISVADIRWKIGLAHIPDELTLEHIGAWTGDNLWVNNQLLRWTGGMNLIPSDEYGALVRRGEIKQDERSRWRHKDPKPGFSYGTPPEPHPLRYKPPVYEMSVDEAAMRASLAQGEVRRRLLTQASYWQRYVAKFIEKYELSADQSEKCMQILRDCEQRRDDYLRRKEKELTAISERKLEKEGDLVIAREGLELLLRPVEDIFSQLKKRLEPIPTRAQRAKADPPPASQPSRAPVSQPSGAGAASQPAGAP